MAMLYVRTCVANHETQEEITEKMKAYCSQWGFTASFCPELPHIFKLIENGMSNSTHHSHQLLSLSNPIVLLFAIMALALTSVA